MFQNKRTNVHLGRIYEHATIYYSKIIIITQMSTPRRNPKMVDK